MNEFVLYINTLIKISEINYGYKSCLSYNDGQWYSRDHSRNLTPEEVSEYILNIVADNDSRIEELLEDLRERDSRE